MTTSDERRRLTEPLESVTTFFGALMIIGSLVVGAFLVFGSGAYGGSSSVCVTQPGSQYTGGGWSFPSISARPGNSVSFVGALHACANNPTPGEQALNYVAGLPTVLFWAGLLFLLWRMLVTARRNGPFTPRVAAALRRLGWFIIIGSTAAAVVQGIATDALVAMMTNVGQPFASLIEVPLRLPVPVLTGAALLTFARIVRAGVAMDAEIQGTI
jgi:Protein of unknown function (DUF2975)